MPSTPVKLITSGLSLDNWDSLTIKRSIDEFADAFSFSCQSSAGLRAKLKPRGYQPAEVWFGNEKLITGQIEKHSGAVASAELNFEGRSKTGPMVDCNITQRNIQVSGMTLLSVAEFFSLQGITCIAPKGDSPKLAYFVTASNTDTMAAFLQKLAKTQTKFIFHSDPEGRLVLDQPALRGAPTVKIVEGQGIFLDASVSVDGTQLFSQYHVVNSTGGFIAAADGHDTLDRVDKGIKVFRPKYLDVSSGAASQIQDAATQAVALGISGAVSIEVILGDWTSNDGTLFAPGQFLELTAPSVWIEQPFTLMVASVTMTLSGGDGRKSSLRCVIPGTYSGVIPTVWPWDADSSPYSRGFNK